ncbi:hypothetical protein [Pontibacter sp. G13]|uniref:hypothetical protein n=1 Tax=Pontibacter sp. G13 TaxID=3074898 RepID=UPI00288A913A|nr:hypothetical protein [Pontibacter sp. G13]WNJ18441.1 hypothetical protein RJD25_26600 [Pontibacter sp. G13]
MEKIKLGIMDVFFYIFPGILVLFSQYLLYIRYYRPTLYIFEVFESINLYQMLTLLAIAYFAGLMIRQITYPVFEFMAKRIWGTLLSKRKLTTTSLQPYEAALVRIRHESPANHATLERWSALRGMCYNAGVAFGLIAISALGKYLYIVIRYWEAEDLNGEAGLGVLNEWLAIFIYAVILFFLSMRRAITFHAWTVQSIISTLNMLDGLKPSSDSQQEPVEASPQTPEV